MVFVDGVEDWSTGIACAQPGLRGRFRTEGAEGLTASCGLYNVFLYIYICIYVYIYVCIIYYIIQLYTIIYIYNYKINYIHTYVIICGCARGKLIPKCCYYCRCFKQHKVCHCMMFTTSIGGFPAKIQYVSKPEFGKWNPMALSPQQLCWSHRYGRTARSRPCQDFPGRPSQVSAQLGVVKWFNAEASVGRQAL